MLVGRGVGLGLGGMNLTDLSKRFSTCSSSSARCYRHPRTSRSSSGQGGAAGVVSSTTCVSGYLPPPPLRYHLESRSTSNGENKPNHQLDSSYMEEKKRSQPRISKKSQQQQSQKKRVVIKKPFNRRAFWAACRAIVIGTLLVVLGAAMCTIGYYREHFAMENVLMADNVTALIPNPTKKVQFHSLAFIGPVVMGAGAFVLMMACVTTLESRDRQARIYQQHQADMETERTPLSRQDTVAKKPLPSAALPPPALKSPTGKLAVYVGADDAVIDKSSSENQQRPKKDTDPKAAYQTAELVAVSARNGPDGVVNRCFTRDDSKTASKPDTDSGPSGTTTTTLTWSKNGGPRCEPEAVSKFPSASCIDNLSRKPDERALLQRFLEDQSRLVEDRLNRRIRLQRAAACLAEEGFRSASLDAPGSEKTTDSCTGRTYRSEEMPTRRNVVAAEVHHAGDASPDCGRMQTVIDAGVDPSLSSVHQVPTPNAKPIPVKLDTLRAPVIAPDALESFSPSGVTPETPSSIIDRNQSMTHKQFYSPHLLSPSPAPRPDSPRSDRSISSSYATVIDGDNSTSIDFYNANIVSQTPDQRTYNTFPNPPDLQAPVWSADDPDAKSDDASNSKFYDSIFLAERLRQKAATSQQQGKPIPSGPTSKGLKDFKCTGATYTKNTNNDVDKISGEGQTGVLCKAWTEMNANYLSNQQDFE